MRVTWAGVLLGLLGCSPGASVEVAPEPVRAPEAPTSAPTSSAVDAARERVSDAMIVPDKAWVPVVFNTIPTVNERDERVGESRHARALRVMGKERCLRRGAFSLLDGYDIRHVELPTSVAEDASCFPDALSSFRARDKEGRVWRVSRPREYRYKRSEQAGALKGYCGKPMESPICPSYQVRIVLEAKTRCKSAHFSQSSTRRWEDMRAVRRWERTRRKEHDYDLDMAAFLYEHATDTLKIVDAIVIEPDVCAEPGEHWVEINDFVGHASVSSWKDPEPAPLVPKRLVFGGPMKDVYGDVDPATPP